MFLIRGLESRLEQKMSEMMQKQQEEYKKLENRVNTLVELHIKDKCDAGINN